MSPKIDSAPSKVKTARIRRAALAAFLAFSPTPIVAETLPVTIGRKFDLSAYPMDFAPGRDSMRDDIARRFDDGGYPIPPAPVRVALRPPAFDITRDDACLTCHNPATNGTVHFKVETMTSGNLAGKRIVSVMVDGYRWEGFAFADDFGVHVWVRKSGGAKPSLFDRYATFLTDLVSAVARGVEIAIESI